MRYRIKVVQPHGVTWAYYTPQRRPAFFPFWLSYKEGFLTYSRAENVVKRWRRKDSTPSPAVSYRNL